MRAIGSLTATVLGSTLVVNNAVSLAEYFNISSIIIGVTVVALGTSLPEVAGTIAAAKMKNPDLGYATDFIKHIGPLLSEIKKQQKFL